MERRLLRFIDKQYPLVWVQSPAEEILTHEERPLATEASVIAACPNEARRDIEAAIRRLEEYQCIRKIYLYAPGDYSEITLAAGKTIRASIANSGSGIDGYQITRFGKETLAEFMTAKVKKVLCRWGEKIAEEYVPLIFVFLLGIFLSSLFGFDLRELLGYLGH